MSDYMEIQSSGRRVVQCGRTHITKGKYAFRNPANASSSTQLYCSGRTAVDAIFLQEYGLLIQGVAPLLQNAGCPIRSNSMQFCRHLLTYFCPRPIVKDSIRCFEDRFGPRSQISRLPSVTPKLSSTIMPVFFPYTQFTRN